MLTPIVIVTLASSLLLFFVNYILYREYRQQALQFWMYSWGFYTIRFLFDLASILVPWFGWDLFLQLSVIASGLFLFQGTYRYLHPKKKIPVGWVLFAAFVGILVLIHPIVSLPPLVTTSFSFLFLGLSNLVMGWYFIRDPSIPKRERAFLGGILIIWGIHKLDYPFLRPFPSFAVWGYTLGSVLGIATGVTLLLVFLSSEKRRAETAESHFFSLVNSLDDVFGILDREGRFTGVFGQWLKRQSVEPSWYIGKTAIDVFGKEIGSTLHEMAMRVFRENTGITFDWEMPLSEGKRYFQTILSPVRDETGACTEIVTVGRDVTSLRQSLEEVQNRLEEKNVLVREIQHRVQNNLQVIISLLNLQMQSESSKEARQALQVAISRIHTFSDLYSQLQDKEDVAHIRMDQFLHSLVSRLLDTGKILDQPELQVETEEVVLPLDRAVTVGLILNELIFNFLEESTSAYIKGRTTVSLKRQGNSIEVILSRKKAEAICTNHPVCTDARSLRHELIQSLLMYVDGTIEDRGTERIVKIRMG